MINVIPDSIPYHRGLARSRWQLRRDAWAAAATEDRRMPSFHLPVKNDMLVVVVTKSLVPYTKGALYHSFFMGTRHAASEAARNKKVGDSSMQRQREQSSGQRNHAARVRDARHAAYVWSHWPGPLFCFHQTEHICSDSPPDCCRRYSR